MKVSISFPLHIRMLNIPCWTRFFVSLINVYFPRYKNTLGNVCLSVYFAIIFGIGVHTFIKRNFKQQMKS